MVTSKDKICLELRNVGVRFHHERILKNISLEVGEQEIVSIIGPNGAGKTTLFNVICGEIRPSQGSVCFRGKNITGWPPHRICRAGIARTFQVARPFPEMTVLENVLIGLRFGRKEKLTPIHMQKEACRLLERAGLIHKADTTAKELTLSEQRRLEVVRALSTNPQVLLLDEMAAGLSPQAVNQAVELVGLLRARGLTLLIIDHFLSLTARVSDRLVALDRGEKILEGKPSEVLQHPDVVSAYLGGNPGDEQEGTF